MELVQLKIQNGKLLAVLPDHMPDKESGASGIKFNTRRNRYNHTFSQVKVTILTGFALTKF